MKITVFGAGNVGSVAAMRIAQDLLGEVTLIDVVKGFAQAKAYDMMDSAYLRGTDLSITGTDAVEAVKGSDIVVITAGLTRKPGMTREDLLVKNGQIVGGICTQVKRLAPQAIVIMVTNPLDVMTYHALKVSGFDRKRVFGMGLTLDASRFAQLISQELSVSVKDIEPVVIGSHGETMLPLARLTKVKGVPLTQFAGQERAEALVQRTRLRGQEIVSLLGTGSAYFAPSQAICELVRAVVTDSHARAGVSVLLDGEFGASGVCLGVVCRLGRKGVEEIVDLELDPQERAAMQKSAESLSALTGVLSI